MGKIILSQYDDVSFSALSTVFVDEELDIFPFKRVQEISTFFNEDSERMMPNLIILNSADRNWEGNIAFLNKNYPQCKRLNIVSNNPCDTASVLENEAKIVNIGRDFTVHSSIGGKSLLSLIRLILF